MYGLISDAGPGSGKRKERPIDAEKLLMHLPPSLRADFPECELFDSLATFNAEVDDHLSRSVQLWNGYFSRKRENGVGLVPRTLRMFIYNTHANQSARYVVGDQGRKTWTLCIEGRLLEEKNASVKFSHFIKHVSIVLDSKAYPAENFVEWDNKRQVETDGFEITRDGDKETRVKIVVDVSYPVQVYRLCAPLAQLLGVDLETHDNVIRALFLYCRQKSLQADESGKLTCDELLSKVIGVSSFHLEDLPKFVRPLLSPLPPIEVEYVVRVSGTPEESMLCYDIQVQDPSFTASASMKSKEIAENDRELSLLLEEVAQTSKRCHAYKAFAKDPTGFIHNVIRSDQRDVQFLSAEETAESVRSAKFYTNPLLIDAARTYLVRQKLKLNKQ